MRQFKAKLEDLPFRLRGLHMLYCLELLGRQAKNAIAINVTGARGFGQQDPSEDPSVNPSSPGGSGLPHAR